MGCGQPPLVEMRIFGATGLALNTVLILDGTQEIAAAASEVLIRARPLESSPIVRLKFRLSDSHVEFDPKKYGWSWVPNTVSWVAPTSMALIALQRAKRMALVSGSELDMRMKLGTEMLVDRACPQGGWNAGNSVVYGAPLRPHIETTALALAALRLHYQLPIVRAALRWLLERVDCRSVYSLSILILAAAAYQDVIAEVAAALDLARNRLVALVQDPHSIEDTSTIALAALALDCETTGNPFEVTP